MRNFIPYGYGAVEDQKDIRDHSFEQAFGSPVLSEQEWKQGYDVEKELGVQLKVEDQNGSSSCVGQSASKLFELKLIEKFGAGTLADYSARFVYANISLGAGVGAYMRDGMKWCANYGCALEADIPSYENGQAPSEAFMLNKTDITEEVLSKAKKVDVFDYRVIDAPSAIDTVASAIRDHKGVMIGFRGTNVGWASGIVRAPQLNETIWGHAVIATRFGQDVVGKWVGGQNSWGDMWGLKGYWKAYEKDYFGLENAQYVFNPWVYVWDTLIPDNIKAMEYIKQNQNKVVQNATTGEFGIIVGDKVLVASRERVAELAMTVLTRNGFGGGVPHELWKLFSKEQF